MSKLSSPLLAALFAAPALLAPSARAAAPSVLLLAEQDAVAVHDAWARASAGTAATGAAYVTLMGGARPESLTGASTPVAKTAELHETINDKGVMKMRPVAAVAIPPGQMVTFAPGGLHIMLMGLKQPLKAGQSFPLTLTFAHAAPVTVDVQVRALGNEAPMGGHDMMPMH